MIKKNKKNIVKILLKDDLNNNDQKQILNLLFNESTAIDIDKRLEENKTFGDKIAEKITNTVGSWKFIICFLLFLISWIILNLYFIKIDQYPFILLNLLLSSLATIQAPIIMMSQNREAKKESIRSKNDYKTDLKSELLLEELHHKIDIVIENQMKDKENSFKKK